MNCSLWQVRGEGVQRCTLGGSAEFTIQEWHSAEISERRQTTMLFFFPSNNDEPRRWTNLAICAEREEHDAAPVLFCLEKFSGESGFCRGLLTQVSAFVPVPMCGCTRSVTTRLW